MTSAPIQGSLTLQNYLAAQRLHYWLRPWAIAFFGPCAVIIFLTGGQRAAWAAAGGAIAMVLLLAIGPIKARQHFRQNKAASEPVSIEVKERGVFFSGVHGSGLFPWEQIFKVRSNNRLALLYRSANSFHVVPREFFASDADFNAFVATVRAKTSAAT
jgi:hypothetical protein